jgi:hypothetical protein
VVPLYLSTFEMDCLLWAVLQVWVIGCVSLDKLRPSFCSNPFKTESDQSKLEMNAKLAYVLF